MFAGTRSVYGSAVVGLAVASVVAVGPISAAPATMHSLTTDVALTAAPSPFTFYPQLVTRTATNAGSLIDTYLEQPLPVLTAVAANEAAALRDAAEALAAKDRPAFRAAVVDALTQPLKNVGTTATFFRDFSQPYAKYGYLVNSLSPFIQAFAGAGQAVADIVEAVRTLDAVGLVNAVADAPGRVVDGFLNGGYHITLPLYPYDPGPGLLSIVESDTGFGPVFANINILQGLGDAIRDSRPDADTDTDTQKVSPLRTWKLKVEAEKAESAEDAAPVETTGPTETTKPTKAAELSTSESAEKSDSTPAKKPRPLSLFRGHRAESPESETARPTKPARTGGHSVSGHRKSAAPAE